MMVTVIIKTEFSTYEECFDIYDLKNLELKINGEEAKVNYEVSGIRHAKIIKNEYKNGKEKIEK